MRRNHSNSGNYRNPCLTMHQPWASLLVYGIKRVEGRSWPAPITGRLWIHAASKVPEESTIKAMEYFYKEIYALNGITDIQFPQHYPVSRLLGCVEVVGCLTRDELACWEMVPEGVRVEAQTDYCWLCERPQKLLIPFEMRGYQGVYNLEKKIYEAAVRGLSPVNSPLPVKFPLPDPQNPFSLKPGSISALTPNLKATEVDKSSSISLAIAGAQAAATQFSKKDQNSHSTAQNNAPTNMNANNEDTEVATSYNLRSQGRSMEKGNISSTKLSKTFDDLTLPSYHEEKSSRNRSEGSSKQNRSPGAEADLRQFPQPPSKVSLSENGVFMNPSEQRTSALEQALRVAETEAARNMILEELEGNGEEGDKVDAGEGAVRVPVVRLRIGEVAEASSVVVLPVSAAEEREILEAPYESRSQGVFGVVVAEKGWGKWVVLPSWDPVVGLGKGGVVVSFPDARVLPWKVNRWYKEEPILVVADRSKKEVGADDGFYLVNADGEGLKVERGSGLKEKGFTQSLGTVLLVVRPPKEENDELSDEDWE
ncbi:hypothetical protein JHK82_028385 [Glycine max]|nr:hypothetical protein JHK87_028301 [Glycine soja]KAG4997621.1 hypothetical protein JHK85_029060 [Glycine max]KAG5127550.1 hypothetical protein JHK82_028385 [Glycine max]